MIVQVNVKSQNSRRVRRGAPAKPIVAVGGGGAPAAAGDQTPANDTLPPRKVADAAIRCMAACNELMDTEALYVALIAFVCGVFLVRPVIRLGEYYSSILFYHFFRLPVSCSSICQCRYVAKLDLMVHVFAIPLKEHIDLCATAGNPAGSCKCTFKLTSLPPTTL